MGSPSPNNLGIVLPGAGGAFAVNGNTEIQNNSIVSSSMSQGLIQFASVALTSANLIAMYATPIQLVAAPGVGKSIIINSWMLRFTYPSSGGIQYTSGGAVGVQFGNTGSGGGTPIGNTLSSAVITGASSVDTLVVPGSSNITLTQNAGLFLSNATGAFATGNGTATAFVWYSIN